MDVEISFSPQRMQVDVIHRFLRESYWSPNIRRDVLENAIAHSLVVGAFDQSSGHQIGFARVVTDTATFAWLCDVYVAPSHRQQGVAQRMIEAVLKHPQIRSLRRWCLATRDAHDLYRRFGFQPVVEGRWMELRLPEATWQDTACSSSSTPHAE